MKHIILSFLLLFFCTAHCQTTVDILPVKDNSIFSESNNSNGLGRLFAGQNSQGNNRRCLIQFDLSSIPNDAQITSAELILNVDQVSSATTDTFMIRRLINDWGEGDSFSGGGSGAAAIAPDATWSDRILGTASWSTVGGDFINTASQTLAINNMVGNKVFESSDMLVADVQGWIDGTYNNDGWIIIGDETSPNSTRRFGSKDQATAPILRLTFTSLGVDDFEGNSFRIRPNPIINDQLSIIAKNTITRVEIYDIQGKVLKAEITDEVSNKFNTSISALADGMYVIKVYGSKLQVSAQRFIKQ